MARLPGPTGDDRGPVARRSGFGRAADRRIPRWHRRPARLDDPPAGNGGHARAAALRRLAPAAPGAGGHRSGATRCGWPRAAPHIADGAGRRRQRRRSLGRACLRRGSSAKALFRSRLLPPGLGALHGGGGGRPAAQCRCQYRRCQSEAHLGCPGQGEGRRGRLRVCHRRRGPSDRPPRYQPRLARRRSDQPGHAGRNPASLGQFAHRHPERGGRNADRRHGARRRRALDRLGRAAFGRGLRADLWRLAANGESCWWVVRCWQPLWPTCSRDA